MDFVRRGARHNQAKLTDDDVREIRRLRAAGVKLAAIGRRFGIGTSNVSDIANRKTWRHLPDSAPNATVGATAGGVVHAHAPGQVTCWISGCTGTSGDADPASGSNSSAVDR